jgi:hypothetical protein
MHRVPSRRQFGCQYLCMGFGVVKNLEVLSALLHGVYPEASLERSPIHLVGKASVPEKSGALPGIKDNKTIRVADEDAPEEYRGQQAIFPGG